MTAGGVRADLVGPIRRVTFDRTPDDRDVARRIRGLSRDYDERNGATANMVWASPRWPHVRKLSPPRGPVFQAEISKLARLTAAPMPTVDPPEPFEIHNGLAE